MLYYLIKFFHLFKLKPLQAFAHFRSLYGEWSDDRRGQLVNEVLCMVPDAMRIDQSICPPSHVRRIIWHLNNAKFSIDLAMYTLSSSDISKTLIAAARRGVRVRIVTQTNCTKMIESTSDIPVRKLLLQTNTLMHNKFCIIDGYQSLRELQPRVAKKPVPVCVTGSLNWMNNAESCDDVFITSAPRICKSLELEFYHIWNSCTRTKLLTCE
ncbi:hypothetical protein KR054_007973 [Drosophila jambulina]|nr:hypothetical protein KR054_007973 [Drosophila jambulina]